ncbi:MAG: hypothetical protein KAS32_11395, partial [Candidatus Peribacteraceae bacterium]|nr:hypothetical protein [Candidatus Peribacteraceae bacterium]
EAKKNYELEIKQLGASAELAEEKERTKRHKNDMGSDSWLSKNIRPLILAYVNALLGYTVITLAPSYLFKGVMELDLAICGFYFTLRGSEKITSILKNFKK